MWEEEVLKATGDTDSSPGCQLGGGWLGGPLSVPQFFLFPLLSFTQTI